MTSSEFSNSNDGKEGKRANSCFQPIGHSRELSVGSDIGGSKIPSNMNECYICKKMIAKAIFEKHYELCSEAKKKECYYKYQQEQITGKMNDVLSQSHSKAGKEIYL